MKAEYPDQWKLSDLGDLCSKPQYGYTASASTVNIGPKLLRITDITDGKIDWDNVPHCECNKKDFLKYKIEKEDLLFARTGSTGSSILIEETPHPAVFASYLIRLKVLENVSTEYLKQFFQSLDYWKQIEHLKVGAVQSGINASVLSSLKVPVPPVVEQRGIAEVLGTVDEAIRLTDHVIERTETLKRGLMQRLLTQGIGHTEFKDTPLGKIPKTWKIMKISDVADTYSGGTPSRKRPDYYTGTIPWIKSGEINKEEIFETEEKITEEALKNSSAKMVNANTLLMAMYGATAGKVAITKIDASINQAIAAIIPKKILAVNPYLYYSLQFILNKVISHTQGSGQPNLSQTIINKIEIAVPPINEQIKISEIISSIDYKIKNNRNYRDKLNTIKQGLMQVLLSGEKRVELREDRLHRINNSGACL